MPHPALPADLATLELVPEGVLVVDVQGQVIWLSVRGEQLLDIGSDAAGCKIDDLATLYTESGDPCSLGSMAQVAGDRISERLFDLELADGRRRSLAIAGRQFRGATLLTIRHAGRRKQLDLARSDLVATVSHELRSPLTSVKGFTKTLLLKWDRFSDDQKRLMLETINEDADRVTRLLTELLDVSRIDANRLKVNRQGVDLAAVGVGVVEGAKVRSEAEGRTIIASVEPVGKALLDLDKVKQVLDNLVENAINYGQGVITVRVQLEDGVLTSAVSDEGPGISADQALSIFEKFGRGREVRRAGTGLGLYISRGLVRAHGGDLTLDSEVGRGSTFTASWPA
ncbi:MAG: signal transduction histidine kinase [Glaciecola sp.]|jgi:signal transduction histidine kinase